MKKVYIVPVFIFILFSSFQSFGQTTYTWNQTGTASWTVATNWTPTRTPASNDILVFNNAATTIVTNVPTQTIGQLSVSGNTTVSLQPAVTGTTLTIAGFTGTDLAVTTGSALNIDDPANSLTIFTGTGATGLITGNMTFSLADHRLDAADANGIVFNSPAIFTQLNTGNVFTNTGTANAIVFNAGAVFAQSNGLDPFALTEPASKVVFNTGSTFLYQPFFVTPLSFSGRKYADLTISGLTPIITCTGSSAVQIDNLSIGDLTLNFNMTGNPGHSIKGNIAIGPLGSLNFTPATAGTINFNGTTLQTISNPILTLLNFGSNQDVVINNPAGLTFTGDVTFNNLVNFTSGVVSIANPRSLTFSSTASVSNASNSSFVNGKVSKIGNTPFTFPVGKTNCGVSGTLNGYAALDISNFIGGAAADQFTAEYIRGNASLLGNGTNSPGIDHVSRCDYWILTRDNGASTVDIGLSWNSTINNCASYPATYINDLGTLTIAHNNNIPGTSPWDNFAMVGSNSGSPAAGQVFWTGTQSTTFGAFSLASTSFSTNPLPIDLNYLNGFKQNGTHLLNWKVTCNNNAAATMVLERSADKQNFTTITTVTATALRCQQPFDYTDQQPLAGINYYRLKMVDVNGKVTYSSVIALLNKSTGFEIVNLLPTIVNSNAILNITAAQKTKMDMVITDITGRQVQKIAYNLIAGSNQFNLNLAGLGAGTYQITGYTADEKSKTIRFVKQ
jgi:hypothetical protein